MTVSIFLCVIGLVAGFLLLWRVPICLGAQQNTEIGVSVIVPARNEEDNLPSLLRSITKSDLQNVEVLVIDDHSTDRTALVAREAGATVIHSKALPYGWTGKTWACYQGAQHASGELLLFLDADTTFVADGLDRLVARWQSESDPGLSISLLPFHVMQSAYEQLSLVFYVLMAAGAGGFGLLTRTKLFGQSLLIPRETYFAVGGHAAVRSFILENLNFANHLHDAGHRILCLGGRGTLQIRMFPEGLRQMSESWTKASVFGASASGSAVLGCSAVWITSLWIATILPIAPSVFVSRGALLVYALFGLQLIRFGRQLGNYHPVICLLYPLALAYYCVVFSRSALRRALGQKTVWRGREV